MATKTEKLEAQLKEIKAKLKKAKMFEKAKNEAAVIKKVKAAGLSLDELDRLLAQREGKGKDE